MLTHLYVCVCVCVCEYGLCSVSFRKQLLLLRLWLLLSFLLSSHSVLPLGGIRTDIDVVIAWAFALCFVLPF